MRMQFWLFCFAGVCGVAQAAPESYSIDPLHTASRFGYDHLGWTWQLHRFDRTTGKIILDRDAKAASVDVVIDAKSINGGNALFSSQLQAPEFFDAEAYPQITYKSTGVKFDGDKLVSVMGDLTIKGITRPVTLTVTSFVVGPHPVQKRREGIGANAVATVKRSDFNMLKQLPLVADEISLSFTVQAFKD